MEGGTDALAVDLLHPEILSTEVLISVLKQRNIQESKLTSLEKSRLVELFYDYVVPLPQRIYGSGRRANRLKRKREASNLDNGHKHADAKRAKQEMSARGDQRAAPDPKFPSGKGQKDRLKPPPVVERHTKKQKVRLTNNQRSTDHPNTIKRSPEMPEEVTVSAKRKKHQPITWP